MKIAARILSLVVLAALTTFYVSCKPDDDPEKSETDQQIEKLNGTWAVSEATLNSGPPDLDHSGMTMAISGTAGNQSVSFSVNGRPAGPSAWPPNGTFAFGTANVKTSLTRDDGVAVSYSVTDTQLIMDFEFQMTPYTSSGKSKSVEGQWHFVFTKQ